MSERCEIDPGAIDAVIFDLDGVITRTASVHEAAWERLYRANRGRIGSDPDALEVGMKLVIPTRR